MSHLLLRKMGNMELTDSKAQDNMELADTQERLKSTIDILNCFKIYSTRNPITSLLGANIIGRLKIGCAVTVEIASIEITR